MFGLSKDEWRDLVLSVNVHRKARRLSPADAARYLHRALQQSEIEVISSALGFSDSSTLRRIIRLNDLPEDLALLVEWGTKRGSLSMSTATELLRLSSPDLIRQAFIGAIEHEMTKDEARQIVQIRERATTPISDCITQALLTRPRIDRTELILGSLVTPKSQATASRLGNDAATAKLKLLLARHYPDIVARVTRINGNRFSLLFAHEDANVLRRLLGNKSIETAVSELLENAQH